MSSYPYGEKVCYGGFESVVFKELEDSILFSESIAQTTVRPDSPYGVISYGEVLAPRPVLSFSVDDSFTFSEDYTADFVRHVSFTKTDRAYGEISYGEVFKEYNSEAIDSISLEDVSNFLFANKAVDVLNLTEVVLGYVLFPVEYALHGSNWFLTLNIDFSSQRIGQSSQVFNNYFNNIRSESFLDGYDLGVGELFLGSPSLGNKTEEAQNTRESVLHFGKLNYFSKDVSVSTFYPYVSFEGIAKSPERLSGTDIGIGLIKFGTFTFTNNNIDRVTRVWPIGLSNFFTSSVDGRVHLDYPSLVKFGTPTLADNPFNLNGFESGVGLVKFGVFRGWSKSNEVIDSLSFIEEYSITLKRSAVIEELILASKISKVLIISDSLAFSDSSTQSTTRHIASDAVSIQTDVNRVFTVLDSFELSEQTVYSYGRAIATDTLSFSENYLVPRGAVQYLFLEDVTQSGYQRVNALESFILTNIVSPLVTVSDVMTFTDIGQVVSNTFEIFTFSTTSNIVHDTFESISFTEDVKYAFTFLSYDNLSLSEVAEFSKVYSVNESISFSSDIKLNRQLSLSYAERLTIRDAAFYSVSKTSLTHYLGSIYSHPIF